MGTKHSTEFKQEAVRVTLTSGLTRKQVAADVGVGFSTLSRWIQKGRQTIDEPSVQSDLEAEVAALRKENPKLQVGRKFTVLRTSNYVQRKAPELQFQSGASKTIQREVSIQYPATTLLY